MVILVPRLSVHAYVQISCAPILDIMHMIGSSSPSLAERAWEWGYGLVRLHLVIQYKPS